MMAYSSGNNACIIIQAGLVFRRLGSCRILGRCVCAVSALNFSGRRYTILGALEERSPYKFGSDIEKNLILIETTA